ncbi:unnamed protein product, partial [Iphiclides podalirius]
MSSNFEVNKNITVHTCCSCLETSSDRYVTLKENCDISQLYQFCTGIPVSPDLPQFLCNKCVKNIKEYAHFKKKCRKSYKVWKSYLNQGKYYEESNTSIEVKKENDSIDDLPEDSSTSHDNSLNDDVETSEDENDHRERTDSAPKYKRYQELDLRNVIIKYKQENYDSCENEGLVKVLECSKCKKQYQKAKCLIKHMMQSCYNHVDVNKLVLVRKFRTPISVDENTDIELFCGICEFASASRDDMKKHLHEHWMENDMRCKLCAYVGKDIAELIGHRSLHQPYEFFSKMENRACHICNKRCATPMRLQFHYRSVHLNRSGGLCTVCRKAFRCYTAWRNHERLHEGGKYICDLCGNKFLFRHQIKTHLAEHSNVRGSICDVCGKGFKRASYLKEHLNTVHTVEPVQCPHCGKTFKCPANLKEHLKHVGKARHFQCEVCAKRFTSAASLKSHAFWHTGERPHACESCGARYKAKAQLKIHMRKHTGQRPYRCHLCDKCFPTAVQLKRHGSVHTGDRPYKCSYCPRSFHYKKLLVHHTASKHGRVRPE